MANCKTFRIQPQYGVPDKEVREWLSNCEKEEGPIEIKTILIPALGDFDPRLTVIVTRIDPLP